MKEKIYLPHLNGVRFIAAFMVIFSHIELNKSYFNLNHNFHNVKHLGKLGVTLFFVLSGFLITYLLIKEKEKTDTIQIKKFYMRRVLRIWPLYYTVIILSLFIFPYFEIFETPYFKLRIDNSFELIKIILLLILFLPNVLINIKLIPFATQTWSVGVEEQFYILWPILIEKTKNIYYCFLGIIIFYEFLRLILNLGYFSDIKYYALISNTILSFELSSLTIGALGAYLFHKRHKIHTVIAQQSILIIISLFLITSLYFNFNFGHFNSILYAILFCTLILNLVSFTKNYTLLENKYVYYLGSISFGLYMYHQIAIVFVINILQKINLLNNYLIYIFSIIITILVSGLSYQFLEKPFLKKKEKLSLFNNKNNSTTNKD